MKTLIVVDMQNDFIDGALGTPEAQAIVPNVKKKIEEYKSRGDEIIFTRDTHLEEYLKTNEGRHLPVEHCIKGTYGWEIHKDLDIKECEHIDKPTFGYTSWDVRRDKDTHTIYGRNAEDFGEIELVGLCTSICVISNAIILKATFPEIDITVDASCCACVTPESHRHALEAMKMCQINVIGE